MALNIHFAAASEAVVAVHEQVILPKMTKPGSLEFATEMAWLRDWVKSFDADGAKFVFDHEASQAIMDFGIELMKEGLFDLPFPKCYFEWHGTVNNNANSVHAMFCEVADGKLMIANALRVDGRWGGEPIYRGTPSLMGPGIEGHNFADGEHAIMAAAKTSFRECAAAVGLLSAKGVRREEISVDPKTNKTRKRLGRKPLPSYVSIYAGDFLSERKRGVGTHASPVPHLRRGHIRNLASGERTIVKPCFVMADPGVMPTYKVNS